MNEIINLQNKNVHIKFKKTKDISVYSFEEITIIVFGYPYDLKENRWLNANDIYEYFKMHGTTFVKKIDGAFSILISGKENIILTDAFGIYNIYYKKHNQQLYISNEIKNLVKSTTFNEADEGAVNEFMLLGYVLGNKTIIKNIRKFEPGSISKFSEVLVTKKYHKIKPISINQDRLIQSFNEHINRGVDLSNKIVLPLTAGLDSRVILSGIMNYTKDLETFTHQTDSKRDINLARVMSSRLNVLHHSHLWKNTFSKELLEDTFVQFECMINPYLFLPLYGSHKIAKKYGDTIWNGNGGEIFRNYYGKFEDKKLELDNLYSKIWVIRTRFISEYHIQLLKDSLSKELEKYLKYSYKRVLNIFYIYNRYANFSGYSLKMSGKIFNIFQPFISKELIDEVIGIDPVSLREGTLLKSIIETNNISLTDFKLNDNDFYKSNKKSLTTKIINKIRSKFFYSNKYAEMITIFKNDFDDLFIDIHPFLEKYYQSLASIKEIKKEFYFITNLMALNKYFKKLDI